MKRTFIAALSLALGLMLASTAMAESWAVSYEGEDDYSGYAMLIADDGTPLTPPDTYSTLYRVTPAGTPEADARYAAVRYALPPGRERFHTAQRGADGRQGQPADGLRLQ